MPYKIQKVGTAYQVVNADTGKVYAKHTTRAKAQAQVRLLHAKEPDDVKFMSDGTRVNIHYTGKKSGKAIS